MSLFNEASLYITSNGTKAGKLYALKGADLDVVRATDGSYVGSNGVIQYALPNVPRLDYSNGSCPSILVEPQRTNLVTYSQDLTNAAYTKDGGVGSSVTRTANYGISPDGTQNATRLQIVRGSSYCQFYQRSPVTIGLSYTLSFWAKSLSGTPTLLTSFDLPNYSNPITFTNEWVRYTYTFVATSAILGGGFNLLTEAAPTSATADLLIWGVQMEQGSYATSYIPTTSASVTRNADVISKTGISGITTITETFEDNTTNVITSPTSYTMSQGRIKSVVGV